MGYENNLGALQAGYYAQPSARLTFCRNNRKFLTGHLMPASADQHDTVFTNKIVSDEVWDRATAGRTWAQYVLGAVARQEYLRAVPLLKEHDVIDYELSETMTVDDFEVSCQDADYILTNWTLQRDHDQNTELFK